MKIKKIITLLLLLPVSLCLIAQAAGLREILAIKITGAPGTVSVECDSSRSAMCMAFGGTCDTGFFKGVILPGAYDNIKTEDGVTTLSARYMLRGVDSLGDSCSIFIENNARANSQFTTPTIFTDSKALAFLNNGGLVGAIDNSGPFTIRIYAPADTAVTTVSDIMIPGHHGLLAASIDKPVLQPGQQCPIVIICHGFGGDKDNGLENIIGRQLAADGIAAIRFDFNGHGKSEGRFQDMTVPNEIEDAKCIYRYVTTLPYVDVDRIAILGISQGGVVAAMTAGELGHRMIKAAVLMCPAAVLRDDCIRGNTFGKQYNPLDPPADGVELWGGRILGPEYIRTAFSLPIYETAARYHGKACIIHGTGDPIAPYTYGERFHRQWPASEIHLLEGYNHGFGPDPQAAADIATDYLLRTLIGDKQPLE